jgi:CheY-like chemotaxis protein
MDHTENQLTFLMADDDEDDCYLVRECLRETGLSVDFRDLRDGEALMDYLNHRGEYREIGKSPQPDLILLDLNMPKKNGREALLEIKSDPVLRNIPIVIFTTSNEPGDIALCQNAGACDFFVKPSDYKNFSEVISRIARNFKDIRGNASRCSLP